MKKPKDGCVGCNVRPLPKARAFKVGLLACFQPTVNVYWRNGSAKETPLGAQRPRSAARAGGAGMNTANVPAGRLERRVRRVVIVTEP